MTEKSPLLQEETEQSPLLQEELVSLSAARTSLIPKQDGRPVHPSTVWRWTRRGLPLPDGSRIWLETIFVGRRPMTSAQAVRRFLRAVTAGRLGEDDAAGGIRSPRGPPDRSPEEVRRLQEAGLLR